MTEVPVAVAVWAAVALSRVTVRVPLPALAEVAALAMRISPLVAPGGMVTALPL